MLKQGMFRNIMLILFVALGSLWGCKKESRFKTDPKDSLLTMESHRFDQALQSMDTTKMTEEIMRLASLYPSFYKLYCQRIIRVGLPNDKQHSFFLKHFLSDTIYQEVYDTVQLHFRDLTGVETDLVNGLKRYNLLFPEKSIPQIFYHISGFNEAIVVGDKILSISLENYLGENHPFYEWLGVYQYKKVQKIPERIARDALLGWITTEFEQNTQHNMLIDEMIYQGKLIFLLEQLLPNIPDNILLGQTEQHYRWCEANEANIWTAMIEWKHLFSKDRLTIKKHIDDAPFNNFFGEGSAAKSGVYMGWRIVSAYMDNNKDLTLQDLFNAESGQMILQMSGYKPS